MPPMPRLPYQIRFLLRHAGWGMSAGAIFVFSLLWGDVMGLGTALADHPLAMFVLFFQMSLTFGAIWMGIAVMSLREDHKDD